MSGGNVLGQYIPVESPVHRLEPHTKLLLTLILATVAFLAGDFVELSLVTGLVIVFTILSRVPATQYVQSLKPMLVLVAVTVAAQLFLSQVLNLTAEHGIALKEEGVRQALTTGLKLLLVCWVAQWLTFTTSPVKLAEGIKVLLTPCRRVGVPVEELAMIATIAIRFVPIVFDEAEEMVKAQASRGADFESLHFRARLNSIISVLVPLVSRCWRRAEDLALAMEIRGYGAGGKRSRVRRSKMTLTDYLFLAIGVLLLIGIQFTGGRG
ncbi:MAG: energy-coupling factor transporter transmembrane protein EcfT [Syntrophothermus sp.]|uniref:energy-coupling factor transporter transmembrane component T family protein n=1 Tax=Syntrophothermus sp. TaxID=2736299 RepID=UPI002579625F|nr:energy-coupling factor transporter transmembrane component T [Syntrophothermus sp.]NSW82662.1 energy-coupling factor transporter transmembrane protein EcfT [Syntrophothermus sp.]